MATLEERTARSESQIEEIRTHFATKADLYKIALAQASFTAAVISIAVGVIIRFG